MRHFYKPRHAADYDARAARAATELSNGYEARHGTPGDFDYQPKHAPRDAGMNRHDVRLLPLVGPQSPGEAW